jgi:nucleotide-binding universal stress UspA family protein
MKNLMVHLDQGERTAARLEIAVALARRYDARLVGVFGRRALPQQVGVVATWPSDEYVQTATASKAAFERATAGLTSAQWRDINRGGDVELLHQLTDCARHFDLIVLGQYDEHLAAQVPAELAEEIVVNAGRPVLAIPCVGSHAAEFRHPLIAWNKSREAAHTLNDALPLIAACRKATVVAIDVRADEAAAAAIAVAEHLACHGIAAETEILVVEGAGIMDDLLSRVADREADLLVIGAHGEIGFPFVSRAAGTRHILRSMTVPVLMSN